MEKKLLPKYFVIKKDGKNPLWKKYIDWLNKTYGSYWAGNAIWYIYYGYDGTGDFYGTNCLQSFEEFQNNPTLLTLEEWDEIVNPKILKVADVVNLHGLVQSVIHGSNGYFLSNKLGLNDACFDKLNLDKKEFIKNILGYYIDGGFPYCKSLEDLTKLVNALRNYKSQEKQDNNMTEKGYEVTREQMGEIHKIACEKWKERLNDLVDVYFNKYDIKAVLPNSIVQEMFQAATKEQKPVLEKIFPDYKEQIIIPKGEWAWVKEYEKNEWVCRCSDGTGKFYDNQKTDGGSSRWSYVFPYNQRPF